jgi:glucosylceramidase
MQNPYQFPQDDLQPQDVPAVTDAKAKVEIMTGASVGSAQVSRRAFLGGAMTIAGGALASSLLAPAPFARAEEPMTSPTAEAASKGTGPEWVATTQTAPWQTKGQATIAPASGSKWDVEALLDQPLQTIEGFGACFNELGWTSLSALDSKDKEAILRELFAPGVGANFTVCRMPVGANDFSLDWYSYDEVPGDFALEHFSISRDLETLVPFIKGALQYQPDLKLWASPWSPPTWMKYNKHYAAKPSEPDMPPNGLRPDQVAKEGTDQFIQEDRYLSAYAAYFARFIQDYAKQDIRIGVVMPQNEFNSAQPFPSCCWTAQGLARFITFLGPEMQKLNVDVFFGTMERPNETLFELSLRDPKAGKYVKGAGFQWAGKRAIPFIHHRYPDLTLYQTEQECGDGKNDWRYCRYAWTLMKHYLGNGASVYDYWNISLKQGGISRWGWAQNSLVAVDTEAKTFRYNFEYYLIKHLSHFVRPGAKRLDIQGWTGYDNLLAFANPDQSVVIMMQNELCQELPVRVKVGEKMIGANLEADSFNTFVVRT